MNEIQFLISKLEIYKAKNYTLILIQVLNY
jgi:hypothetical protein